jgi:uncharacterized protein YecT (DUF1311 family)
MLHQFRGESAADGPTGRISQTRKKVTEMKRATSKKQFWIATTIGASLTALTACGASNASEGVNSASETASTQSRVNCATPLTTAEMLFCAGENLKAADARLNAAWPAVQAHFRKVDKDMADLGIVPPGAKSSFDLITQLAWIRYRDNECIAESARYSNGSLRGVEVLGCKSNLTNVRTEELKGIVLESAAVLDERATTDFARIEARLPECKDQSSNVQYKFCLGKIYGEADRILNSVYQELKAKLNGDDAKALTESELAWITIRDSECEARARLSLGGTGYTGFLSLCYSGRTIIRTDEILVNLNRPEGH